MNVLPPRETLKATVQLAVAGIALGLLANAFSPRGLSLRRDYFPLPVPGVPLRTQPATSVATAASPGEAMDDQRKAQLAQNGVNVISHARAAELFAEAGRAEGRIVFVDARDDSHYASGHIPGAIQFDHYRMENHIVSVLEACAAAERVVVYCNGGECEDSELVAKDLLQLGVPSDKLLLYSGGIAEWKSRQLPVATGALGADSSRKP